MIFSVQAGEDFGPGWPEGVPSLWGQAWASLS